MAWYQIQPAFINFFVRKYFNFLLPIFTIAYLVCFLMLLTQLSDMKNFIFKGGNTKNVSIEGCGAAPVSGGVQKCFFKWVKAASKSVERFLKGGLKPPKKLCLQ